MEATSDIDPYSLLHSLTPRATLASAVQRFHFDSPKTWTLTLCRKFGRIMRMLVRTQNEYE